MSDATETRAEEKETGSAQAEPPEQGTEAPEAEMTQLLEDARAKADDHWDQLLRTQAELENFRRRSERELENAHKYGIEKLVQELIPVVDSMELGLQAVDNGSAGVDKFREGSELTLKMMHSVLEKFGIKQVDPVGEKFNPEAHQAMTMQESAEHEPNTVLTVVQKGYQLHERVVRPAMVVVSKAAQPPKDTPDIDEMA